jgi:hypothetical protein
VVERPLRSGTHASTTARNIPRTEYFSETTIKPKLGSSEYFYAQTGRFRCQGELKQFSKDIRSVKMLALFNIFLITFKTASLVCFIFL